MSIDELFSIDKFDRVDYFDEREDEWTRDELLKIVELANKEEDGQLLNSIAMHPLSTQEDLKHYALSGQFNTGTIKSVLLNDNCSEDILRSLYNLNSESEIFNYARVSDDREYGEGAFNKYVNSYIDQFNELAREHKNFPTDLK